MKKRSSESTSAAEPEPALQKGASAAPSPVDGPPIRVLLVEDNEDDATLVHHALASRARGASFSVTHVGNLSAASEALAERSYDVLLLDLSLPDTGGRETIRRGLEVAGTLPVLVLTGLEDDGLALEAVQRGAQDYVIKGVPEPGALQRAIMQALERHRAVVELKASNEAYREKAYRDPLTGLFNREYFLEALGQDVSVARRYEQTMALLFIDMDKFKAVNDTLGHHAGDRLLVRVARLLRATVRESDSICRYAGDEFVVLLRDLSDPADAMVVARKLLRELRHSVGAGGRTVTPGASIGIAIFPGDGESGSALLRNADAAMYAAKAQGNTALFFSDVGKEAGSVALDYPYNRMYASLQDGEFQVFYQPVVDGANGAVIGVEALARWDHPTRGVLLPRSFLDDMTAFGLLSDLSERVLADAARQFLEWAGTEGSQLQRLSVNLSHSQVIDSEFPRRLQAVLAHTHMSPERLELELPEQTFDSEGGAETSVVEALREIGVRVILDDLGVESATLSRLRRMRVDGLKLDRSLVQNAPRKDSDRAIVLALIHMARGLRIEVTAEGVEAPEQRDFLLEHGCRRMQGFLFGRPVPPEEFRLTHA